MSGTVIVIGDMLIAAAAILLGAAAILLAAGSRSADRGAVQAQALRLIRGCWALSMLAIALLLATWALSTVVRS